MSENSKQDIFSRVQKYIVDNQNKGYNPYDLLASPYFYNKIKNHKILVLLTQLNKISPINFREILKITKRINPKAQALIMIALINNDFHKFRTEIELIKDWLIQNKSDAFDEYTIGFSFPICMSHYTLSENEPSLIITIFVMYAFMRYYNETGEIEILNLVLSFKKLLDQKLQTKEDNLTLCYSYNFEKYNEIYNSTAKIGKFYALLYEITKDVSLIRKIEKIQNYLLNNQRNDGSWAYGPEISYSDSFHTAFILESIIHMRRVVDKQAYKEMFEKGMTNYLQAFIKPNGQPRYIHPKYSNKGLRKIAEVTATDIRDVATAIDLLLKTNRPDLADNVLNWALTNLFNSNKGYFYFYKEKLWTNKIEHIRPQGWMLYALSCFLSNR